MRSSIHSLAYAHALGSLLVKEVGVTEVEAWVPWEAHEVLEEEAYERTLVLDPATAVAIAGVLQESPQIA